MPFDPSKPFSVESSGTDNSPAEEVKTSVLPSFDPAKPFVIEKSTAEAGNTAGFDPSKPFGIEPPSGGQKPESGWIIPGRVLNSEVESIAKKHGVSSEDLGKWVAWYGGLREDLSPSELNKFAAGESTEMVAAGLPQFLAKKTTEENFQRALDDLADLVGSRKSTLQRGAELAGTVASSLAGGAAVGKAIPALAKAYQLTAMPIGGAVAALSKSKTGEELESAGLGAAIGAAIPVVAGVAGKLVRAGADKAAEYLLTGKKTLESLVDTALEKEAPRTGVIGDLLTGRKTSAELAPEEVRLLLDKPGLPEVPPGVSPGEFFGAELERTLGKTREDISRRLKTGSKDFSEVLAEKGPEAVESAYEATLRDKAAIEVAKNGTLSPLGRLERGLLVFLDAKPAYEILDKRLGTNISRTQNEASKALNEAEWAFAGHNQEASSLARTLDEAGSSAVVRGESAEVAKPWDKLFDDVYETGKNLEATSLTRENTIPQFILPREQYKVALANEARTTRLLELDGEAVVQKIPELGRLLPELELATGRTAETINDARGMLGEVLSDARGSLYARARNSRNEWTDTVPSWLRDENLVSVYTRATNNIKKAYALPDHLEAVTRAGKTADAAGDSLTADYLKRHLRDISGATTDVFTEARSAAANKYFGTLEQKLSQAEGYEKELLRGRGALPDFLNTVTSQVYTNALGLSPKAALQNLASPFTTSINEVGADYALRLWTEAQADLAKLVTTGIEIELKPHMARYLGKEVGEKITTRNPALLAYNEGLIGPSWKRELLSPETLRLKRGAISQMASAVDRTNSAVVLAAFEGSERLGRATISFMGKRLADDLVERPELVDSLIKSPAYRSYLKEIISGGKPLEDIRGTVVDYLNSHTLMNYDKLNMSEYGRAVGPLFRQFTKWPAYQLGRMVQPFYEKGLGGGLSELAGGYLLPVAGFHAIDKLMDTEDSPRVKKLLGTRGLADWAPGASTLPLFESAFGIQKTPLVGVLVDTAKSIKSATGDNKTAGEALSDWSQRMYSSFGFGSSWLRFLGEDIPQIATGHEPDKKTSLIERRLRGLGL